MPFPSIDEKSKISVPITFAKPDVYKHTSARRLCYVAFFLSLCIIFPFTRWGTLSINITDSQGVTTSHSSDNIEFIGDFEWDNDFQCARLDVPLNWNASASDNNPRAAIAIVKIPAKVPVTDERYGGAILFNPGGPGGSGVQQVLMRGKDYQTIVDSGVPSSTYTGTVERYFDVIGFDPRGVNNTTPHMVCWADAFRKQVWDYQQAAEPMLGSSDAALNIYWSRAVATAQSCSHNENINGMARYLNTAQVVEDMVEIIEKHGEWRELEAQKLTSCALPARSHDEDTRALERTAWKQGKEQLLYWGFSYGTILGATFSAMHPDKVGRVIIDGVVDTTDYYSADWLGNLQDTDKIITAFCEYCYQAGPERCPLYTGDSASDIEAHIEDILARLKENPISVMATSERGPEIVTYDDVMSELAIRDSLYHPYRSAEGLFETLAELGDSNASSFADRKQNSMKPALLTQRCERDGPFSEACMQGIDSATHGILCMDGEDLTHVTKDDYREYMKKLRSQSRWLGDSWAIIRIGCPSWTVRPEWTFEGQSGG